MTKSWRPKGWKLEQPFAQYDQDGKEGEIVRAHLLTPSEKKLFEAGADAMLNALRDKAFGRTTFYKGTLNSVNYPDSDFDKELNGISVFIPDDKEK